MHTHHSNLLTTETMSQLVKCIEFTTEKAVHYRKYVVKKMVLTNGHNEGGKCIESEHIATEEGSPDSTGTENTTCEQHGPRPYGRWRRGRETG